MLTEQDISFIEANAYTSEHDYLYYSLILGEPYLIEGCLCYFDGQHITIEGSHLLRENLDENKLRQIIAAKPEFSRARSVWYWGPSDFRLDAIPGMSGVLYSTPCETDTDQYIKLQDWTLSSLPKARNRAKHAENNGVVVRSSKENKVFTWEHYELLKKFYEEHRVSLSDTMFSVAVRPLICCPSVKLLNTYDASGALVGFGLVNEIFPRFHTLLQSFFNKACTGAADLFYRTMIEEAKRAGVERLHFGHSVGSKSLSDFKKKWGAKYNEDPYTFIGFFKDRQAKRELSTSFMSFWERLVGDQLVKAWEKDFEEDQIRPTEIISTRSLELSRI